MASPGNVVPSFRKQAYAVYALLLIGFVIYVIFSIVTAVNQRDNPPIKVERLNKIYKQPAYTICPPVDVTWSYDLTADTLCLLFESSSDVTGTNCGVVENMFDTTRCLTFNRDRVGSLQDRMAELTFRVIFDANSTQEIFSKDMSLFIHEGSWDDAVLGIDDPTKVTEYRIGYPFVSAATIRREEQESIGGDVTATYTLSMISTQLNQAPDGRDYIDMSVRIPSTVVPKTTEVDPLNALTIMGSIAGMWGLVGGFFGFLFAPVPALEELRGVHRRPLWVRGKTKGLDESNYDTELQRFQRKETMRAPRSIKVHSAEGGGGRTPPHVEEA